MSSHMCGSRGGTGGPDPPPPLLKNHKNIGFLSNCGLDHLKITKLPSQHSMFGHHRHSSETPFLMAFRWRANDGTLIVVFGSSFPSWTENKRTKKTRQSWTPPDNTLWILACIKIHPQISDSLNWQLYSV